jgi:hypothetical protein
MHQVLGSKREFVAAAMKRLTEHRLRDFLNSGPFPESLIQKLRVIFPEKCAYLGNGRIRTIIHSATAAAEQYGLVVMTAPVLVTILMFLLGHEVDRDPINPWVKAMFRDTAFMEPSLRIETLENRVWEEVRDGLGRFT